MKAKMMILGAVCFGGLAQGEIPLSELNSVIGAPNGTAISDAGIFSVSATDQFNIQNSRDGDTQRQVVARVPEKGLHAWVAEAIRTDGNPSSVTHLGPRAAMSVEVKEGRIVRVATCQSEAGVGCVLVDQELCKRTRRNLSVPDGRRLGPALNSCSRIFEGGLASQKEESLEFHRRRIRNLNKEFPTQAPFRLEKTLSPSLFSGMDSPRFSYTLRAVAEVCDTLFEIPEESPGASREGGSNPTPLSHRLRIGGTH